MVQAVGKGSGKSKIPSRNVDILLAAPRSKVAQRLHAAHVYLQLHPDSGVWLLRPSAEVSIENVIVEPNEKTALNRSTTHLEVADMQYLIHFIPTTPAMEQSYLEERDRVYRQQGIPLPRTRISGIPFSTDTALRSIVFRHGLGSGSFGNVFEGFHPKKGDLRVAKRVTLKSKHEVPYLEKEIRALIQFKGHEGILDLLDWRTPHDEQNLYVLQYPLDVYMVHEKGVAFDKCDWKSEEWNLKRLLCYQLLKGLVAIHQAGCMHRDITPMNIIFLAQRNPPQAALCDFGKFCNKCEDTETRLAAWYFLPPELQPGAQHQYGQSLDIWMLGLALVISWWPQIILQKPRERLEYNRMQEFLQSETQDVNSFAQLIAWMVTWSPDGRPSAAEALKHKSLQDIAGFSAPVKTSNAKRLHDCNE